MSTEPYDATFFEGQSARSLSSARVVLGRVFSFLQPRRVLDVGCGIGTWLRAAQELGATDVLGTDGDYVDPATLLVNRDRFVAGDIAADPLPRILGAQADQPFDLVICMEVAEHLPHARGPSLAAELAALSDAVLFSAAVPFQFGTQHVNEQWPEYWSILFRTQGFECFDPLRDMLWNDPDVEWWYAQNALLFARSGSAAAAALPAASRAGGRGLARVHPDNLLANLLGLPRRYRLHASQEEVQDLHSLVAANRHGASAVPALVAPARAAAAPDAPDVFPRTRMEVWQPEPLVARLEEEAARAREEAAAAREEAAAGREEAAAGREEAVAGREEAARAREDAAELSRRLAETGEWLAAANRAFAAEREARFAAEREAARWHDLAQAHAAERLHAKSKLAELGEVEAARHAAQEAERTRAAAAMREATAALEAQRVALDQRAVLLDAQDRRIEAVRRSPVWRVARRARRIGSRLTGQPPRTPPDALPAPAAEAPAAGEALPDAAAPAGPETAPDPYLFEPLPIKRFGEVLGHIARWGVNAGVSRLKQLEVFDAEDYLRRNQDVAAAGVDPYAHFIQSGALEGRGRTNPENLARIMSGLTLFDHAVRAAPPDQCDDSDLPQLIEDVRHVGLFVSSHGNVFMDDLAEDLAADLRSTGIRVDVLDETSDIDTRPPTCLFIAPHEFFTLGRGTEWVRDDVLCESFVFGTEQVQTSWFNLALPFVLMSRGVVDICPQTASLFERLAMATLHVLPGARQRPHKLTERDKRHPLFGVLPRAAQRDSDPVAPFADRTLDISFFGTSSPRRDAFFARNAAFFAEYECFNYCRRPGRGPIRGEGEDGALTRLAGHVAGHSKITLNIHREEFGYFEWHRMVWLGMCAGSLVVSDPCLPHPDFVANEHYLQENARHIPELLEWLLRTEDGAREAERVRGNVVALISRTFGTAHTAAQLLRFFAQYRSRNRG